MLKIFRRIRQKSIVMSKVKNYFLYALGEVILVVIGILIALQINSSYQQSLTKKLEIKYLKEMQGNLIFDLKDIEFNIEFNESRRRSNEAVLYHLTNDLTYHDSLDYHLSNLVFTTRSLPNMGAYESLKSKGLEIISNDSLRANMTYVYSFSYPNAIDFEHADDHPFQFDVLWPEVIKSIEFKTLELDRSPNNRAKPINYEAMKENIPLKNALKSNLLLRGYMITSYRNLKSDVLGLIEHIESELEVLAK